VDARIDRLQRLSSADPRVIALGGGLPARETFPRLGAVEAAALQYDWPEGRERLRAFVAARLRARGAQVGSDDVLITAGGQQAIAIAAELVLGAPPLGAPSLGVDEETYPAALDRFRSLGYSPTVGPAGVGYVMPALSNPTGRAREEDACRALIRSGMILIEDDAYAELRFDGAVPPPLVAAARERVWHLGTFSKTLCPGLRVGWLVPPPLAKACALELKRELDLMANGIGQALLERFLHENDWDARLARLRALYAARAERMMCALRRHLPSWRFAEPAGGFSLWCESPEPDQDDVALLTCAVRHGVAFDPGRLFRPMETCRPLAIRLCFSAEQPSRIEEGVRRLAIAWDAFRRSAQHRMMKPVSRVLRSIA
jgi:2-aminoadipate transaminase